jgi:hypothetical protein
MYIAYDPGWTKRKRILSGPWMMRTYRAILEGPCIQHQARDIQVAYSIAAFVFVNDFFGLACTGSAHQALMLTVTIPQSQRCRK